MPFSGQGMLTELSGIISQRRALGSPSDRNLQSSTVTLSGRRHATKRTVGVEVSTLVAMQGDVEYRWVVIESPLGAITCVL